MDHTGEITEYIGNLTRNLNTFFLLINGIIIFLMQCGFAFLEAGSVRAKNTTNILIKNLLDVFLGAVAYWAIGYAFAFGDPSNAFLGHSYFFFHRLPEARLSHFFFHFVFAATAATIVSGAMAERTAFKAYMIYSVFITGIIYPVVSHWAWSETGWLAVGPGNANVHYQDFAGSSVVHMVGGTAALVGAAVVGPRTGRFTNGADFRGHTVPLVALGGFILFFGFFSFNGGSRASISEPGDGVVVANAIVNTIICGSAAALVALVLEKLVYGTKKWSLLVTINGGLTGMVSICAGCGALYAWGAFATGVFAGAIFVGVSALMEKVQIDDPLDAVAVHLGGGLWGILTVPLLDKDDGVFFKWDGDAFVSWGWNALGACAIMVWTGGLCLVLFGLLRFLKVLRVDLHTERLGLDVPEHGEPAYPLMAYIGNDNRGNLGIQTGNMRNLPIQVSNFSNITAHDNPTLNNDENNRKMTSKKTDDDVQRNTV
ncbi:Ammonium transporter 1 member 2 [Holothuria leucospilota]|uniref:Ammonium transporter n=1 Tax=Holothuria leucospilota TaxID=206669 RepID=A0A9Q0YJA8_HOLLE|nr:Ammonium transporter 1 member 2 [Holothuria leucospilota]